MMVKKMKVIGIILAVVLLMFIGYLLGRNHTYHKVEKALKEQEKRRVGINNLYEICSRWMLLQERNIKLADFLNKNDVKTVAVYGMGRIGKTIMENLRADNFKALYGIDFHSERVSCDYPVYNLKNDLPEVDMILVTVTAYEDVKKDLSGKTSAKILNIRDVFDVMLGE